MAEKTVTITLSAYQALQQSQQKLAEQRIELAVLKEELANLKKIIFGSKRERFLGKDTNQLSLDLEGESKEHTAEQEPVKVSYVKKKKNQGKAKRLLFPDELARRTTVIEPDLDNPLQTEQIGVEVTERLAYEPGKLYVERLERPKYLRKGRVHIGELPPAPIGKGSASANLLAHILVSKFIDHLPFYRQIQQFKRHGIKLAEATLTGWFSKSCELLVPLYELLLRIIEIADYVQVDETAIPVQSSQKKGATHTGYHWMYSFPEYGIILAVYEKGRGREGPEAVLKKFKGAMQTDGYTAYNRLGERRDIRHIECMAHARRKFTEAQNNDPDRSAHALGLFQKLYAVERQAKENKLTYGQTAELRQKEAVPVLDELEAWLIEEQPKVLPKSGIGKAVHYALNRWKRLTAYTENGKWQIDNNTVENKIRPIALGRKNYLFAGSHTHAQYAAMMYSFFSICKLNNVEPMQWLTDTLQKIGETRLYKLYTLLPVQDPEKFDELHKASSVNS